MVGTLDQAVVQLRQQEVLREMTEIVALATRRNKFERTGRGKQFDETLPLDHNDLADATAAILATLAAIREPTPGMMEAGPIAVDDYYNGTKDAPFEGSIKAVYQAMIAQLRAEYTGESDAD